MRFQRSTRAAQRAVQSLYNSGGLISCGEQEVTAMEEDIVGWRRESVAGNKYTFCTACGRPVPRSRAILINGEALADSKSEHGELCKECADLVAKGDLIPLE
jgi:hypothetical protein